MSLFADNFQGIPADLLFERNGRTVTYHPHEGDQKDITGIWKPDSVLPSYYPDGEQEVGLGVMTVKPVDVTDPDVRDYFTIDSVKWPVVSIGRQNPFIDLQLKTRVQRKVGGDGHIIKR